MIEDCDEPKIHIQCWICPNCHDDHSQSKPCPEFERVKGELEMAQVRLTWALLKIKELGGE